MASLSLIAVAIAVFASTNIDDILLLSVMFADPNLKARNVVVGQFIGIGALVAASAAAAFAALAVPEGWIALLGVVPLGLGLRGLLQLLRPKAEEEAEEERLQGREPRAEARLHAQVLAVAGVTVANGGDNLGVYIPLFASAPAAVPAYATVFAAMTAVWCILGYGLVNNRVLGGHVRRYGHIVLPFVLVGLGLHILSDARALLG